MKKRLFFKSCLVASIALLAAACDDDANIGGVDTGKLEVPGGDVVYVTDAAGKRNFGQIDLHAQPVDAQLVVKTVKAIESDVKLTFKYDASLLDEYNKAHDTEFTALPEAIVSFQNGGVATLEAGQLSVSYPVTITPDAPLEQGKSYALPIRVAAEGAAQLGYQDDCYIFLINDMTALPNCNKTWTDENGDVHPGIKIFSVMEVNDTNPLNNLRYTLKESGKYMVDALVMFSGNINYDQENNEVILFPNENITAILNNREKYLKPLKDRGMKVIMGVMCNHDRACISNLNAESAKIFAKKLKDLCDAYDLDGIFWDDEYCSPIYPAPPGFESRSNAAWSRLAYELWKIQPERWNIAYGYSMTGAAQVVDGVQPGTYISYCLPDYSSYYDTSWLDSYPGMTLSQLGGCSMQFAQGSWAAPEDRLRDMRNEGFGAMMVFAMDPFRPTSAGQDDAMRKLARAFYNDEAVVDPVMYKKDW